MIEEDRGVDSLEIVVRDRLDDEVGLTGIGEEGAVGRGKGLPNLGPAPHDSNRPASDAKVAGGGGQREVIGQRELDLGKKGILSHAFLV